MRDSVTAYDRANTRTNIANRRDTSIGMLGLPIFVSIIWLIGHVSTPSACAVGVSISNGDMNVNACDLGDCVANFSMMAESFILPGGGLAMGLGRVLEPPGPT